MKTMIEECRAYMLSTGWALICGYDDLLPFSGLFRDEDSGIVFSATAEINFRQKPATFLGIVHPKTNVLDREIVNRDIASLDDLRSALQELRLAFFGRATWRPQVELCEYGAASVKLPEAMELAEP